MAISTTTIVGRLTKDPVVEYKQINGDQVAFAKFTVAVDEYNNDPDFYNVVAWRKLAENAGKFLEKGREVAVTGRMKMKSYTKNVKGEEVFIPAPELRAAEIQFIGGRGDNSQGGNGGGQQRQQRPANQGNRGGQQNNYRGNQGQNSGYSNQNQTGPVPGQNNTGGGSPWGMSDDDLPF
ncbi:single-stranded DNA-binding protein A_gp282 [Bacillus phage vB_BceM_WH1]|nr:single-stranded DNA-binding protein A_gp282 [Bacillus phage vB_BceM_WH1]